jgi:ABC-type glutathione transport system ATPase component
MSTRPFAVMQVRAHLALDVSVQVQTLNPLSDLRSAFGLATLIITHDKALVREFAKGVLVLLDRKLVEEPTGDVLPH